MCANRSVDGHIKFWKKLPETVEFVKHYRSHLGPILAMAGSEDGTALATCGDDKACVCIVDARESARACVTSVPPAQAIKFYDVIGFDMVSMISLDFTPSCCVWATRRETGRQVVRAMPSCMQSPAIA